MKPINAQVSLYPLRPEHIGPAIKTLAEALAVENCMSNRTR